MGAERNSRVVSDSAEDARVVTEKVPSTRTPWGRARSLEKAARAGAGYLAAALRRRCSSGSGTGAADTSARV